MATFDFRGKLRPQDLPEPGRLSMPAEWAPRAGTWLGWPCNVDTWPDAIRSDVELAFRAYAEALSRGETVNFCAGSPGVADRIRQLVADGTTAIFVSHDLSLVEELCDRVIRIEQGRVVDDGPTSEVVDRLGGSGWEGGVMQRTSAVRVDQLVLRPRQLPEDGRLEFDAVVEVFEPSPNVRVEFSYLAPTDKPSELSEEQIAASTLVSRTVVPAGGMLSEVGRYRLSGHVPQTILLGALYVVLTVVDERDAIVTAKTWQVLKDGTRVADELLRLRLEVDWELVEDLDAAPSVVNVT